MGLWTAQFEERMRDFVKSAEAHLAEKVSAEEPPPAAKANVVEPPPALCFSERPAPDSGF